MAESVSREEASKKPINLFALFPKFNFQLPFSKQQPQPQPQPQPEPVPVQDEATSQKPVIVRFPKAQPVVPPVASEVEEPITKTSNPIFVWQVYALGGFLVLKWIWARWQERKDQKEDSSDDEQPSVDE